ncbi:DNA ligase D [Baekduia sp. Peel2402]|uniref:DNA ligase D n=1 Tax=Baekduia sp. Peel2402 TaxID=3458296 RepID=UPI00403ED4E6
MARADAESDTPNLAEYAAKRDFSATPEPAGGGTPSSSPESSDGALRFVIQEHSATRLHWDLRLEHDGALTSFAIPNGLPWAPGDNRLAVRTEDHPMEYLEFHGEIPKGSYGAGTMTIWDRGTYEVQKWDAKKIEVELAGERVTGGFALFPIGPEPKDWMIHRMGGPAPVGGWVLGHEPMPEALVPMLAKAGEVPPAREDKAGTWAYEVKWDGIRAVLFSEPGRMRFVTRNGNDVTSRYPELSRLNRALSMHRAVLDGEIVAFDDQGRPSFAALQGRMHLTRDAQVKRMAKEAPVSFLAFDLLWLDGRSLTGLTYLERRAALRALLADGERWQVPDHVVGGGEALLAATREQGLEGIVAKKVDSPYEPGRRSGAWRKIKNTNRQELIIGGWLPGEGRRRERIGALLVGVRDGEDGGAEAPLRFAGRVGTGFTEAELNRLAGLLAPLERGSSPFDIVPTAVKIPREACWVEPELVCEVEFVEWTREGVLRAPSYKGLRDDKPAALVVREPVAPPKGAGRGAKAVLAEVGGHELRLTNRDKALWPSGHTKGDLINYYVEMAEVLLPHLQGRPLTLKRYPSGTESQFFYEKQAPAHRPDWVRTTPVKLEGGKTINYVLAEDVATLAWLGNLADLELHTPMHRAAPDGKLSPPAMIVFDLDPGEPAGLLECCQIATVLRGMFQHLGLESVVKTSGSKGMQMYVPLNVAGVTYTQTRGFAKAVAELLEAEAPDLVVARQTKTLRKGKILVDWMQNDVNKTTVSVYSPRGRERPTVSTPLAWDEVQAAIDQGNADGLVFDMADVLARVRERGDLFADALTVAQELPGL